MATPIYNLFVYGSLRSGFRNPAYQYLTQYFTYQGEALVKGNLYNAGSHPVAVPAIVDNFITGELYCLNNLDEFSWAFEQLDDYEGLHVEPGETPLYKRELAEVYQNGKTQTAYIYWYNKNIDTFKKIETGDVLKYIQQKNMP